MTKYIFVGCKIFLSGAQKTLTNVEICFNVVKVLLKYLFVLCQKVAVIFK